MSGKGYNNDDEHQTLPEILTFALGWTHSVYYIVTMHLLILAVQIYLFWPLLPNFPHVWGDNVVGMVMAHYGTGLSGAYGYITPVPEISALLGPLSHVFGMVAIVMLLVHTVSHHIILRIAIPSSLWFGSVFLFNLVDFIRTISREDSTLSQHPLLC